MIADVPLFGNLLEFIDLRCQASESINGGTPKPIRQLKKAVGTFITILLQLIVLSVNVKNTPVSLWEVQKHDT